MNIVVLDKSFTPVAITDIYDSIIWTERYNECGDFEIYVQANTEFINMFKEDYYLQSSESEYTMVIEHVQIQSDVEDGDKLIISGRSLESVLDRRIIWDNLKISNSTAVDGIKKILDANVIDPRDVSNNNAPFYKRRLGAFYFDEPTDASLFSARLEASYYGATVLETIQSICQQLGWGFRIRLIRDTMHFQLFNGLNLSADTSKNLNHKIVVFSASVNNMISSNYELNRENYKNVTLVGGIVDEGNVQKRVEVEGRIPDENGNMTVIPEGLDRREVYTDATSLSNKDESNNVISDSEYNSRLANEGNGTLNEFDYEELLDASVEPNYNWKYGNSPSDDYYLGDIVTISNNYGMDLMARVTEVVRSHDTSGYSIIPSFTTELFDTQGTSVSSIYSTPGGGTGGAGGSSSFVQEQSDWAVDDPNSVAYIRNKPDDLPDIGGYYVPGTNSTAAKTTNPYYAARWRGTCAKVSGLYSGLTIWYKVEVAGHATYGVVLDINDLGEHPVVRNVNTNISTNYAVGAIISLTYDADQAAEVYQNSAAKVSIQGCWKVADYDANTDTTYLLRNYNGYLKLNPDAGALYRYMYCMTDMENRIIPFNNVSNKATTYTKAMNTVPFNPFGPIYYYATTTAISAGGEVAAANMYTQRGYDCRYSMNINSAGTPGLTSLTANMPVYIRALYNNSTHLATFTNNASDASYLVRSSIVQSLPSAEEQAPDGYRYIYIYLGYAYSLYQIEITQSHPVFYWNRDTNSLDIFRGSDMGLRLAITQNQDQTYTAEFYI